jgi:hypothetical protein
MNDNKTNDDELDQLQEELTVKDEKKQKPEMPVSGRSVFDILKIKKGDKKK